MKKNIEKQDITLKILDSLTNAISYVDCEQRYRYNNAAYEEWFHIKAEDCYGKHIREVIGPEGYQKSKPFIEAALQGKKVTFNAHYHTSFGALRETKVTFDPDLDMDGICKGFVVNAMDTSEERTAIRALESSRKQFRQLFDATPAGMVVYEVLATETNDKKHKNDFRFLKLNNAALRIFDLPGETFIGKTMIEVFPKIETYWLEMLNEVHENGNTIEIEEFFKEVNAFFTVCCFRLQEGLLACSFINITEQKNTERRYRKQREKSQSNFDKVQKHLLSSRKQLKNEKTKRKESEVQTVISDSIHQSGSEGVCVTDENAIIIRVNPAFTAITGYSEKEALGQNPRILQSHHQHPSFYVEMWKELLNNGAWKGEIWNRRKNGESYLEHLSINTITDKKSKTTHYVAVFHDITELYNSRQQIIFHSSYDTLTGLPNRRLFISSCDKLIDYCQSHHKMFAVALLDIDNFKDINETLGYAIGDTLLKLAGERISECCRSRDIIARLGGDEFTILLDNSEDSDGSVDTVLLVVNRVLTTLSDSFSVDGQLLSLKASIGVAIFPSHGNDSNILLQHAEIALYQAKKLGGSRITVFTEEAEIVVKKRITLKNNLLLALERDEFTLHYQPKVTIADNRITGVEALIRWYPSSGKMISPVDFIPLAEESDLINEIGAWVIEKSSAQLQIWQQKGWNEFSMAINLSARQFADPNLLDLLLSATNRYKINPASLHLEITEHTMVEQIETTIATMKEIKKHGFLISIDDFGTGFSSLAYLKDFPIDILKIDRTFVRNIPDDRHDITIINLSLSLARSLDLAVIAEGVETKAQLELLRELGCDEYQGYHCSRPLPSRELEDFIDNY